MIFLYIYIIGCISAFCTWPLIDYVMSNTFDAPTTYKKLSEDRDYYSSGKFFKMRMLITFLFWYGILPFSFLIGLIHLIALISNKISLGKFIKIAATKVDNFWDWLLIRNKDQS